MANHSITPSFPSHLSSFSQALSDFITLISNTSRVTVAYSGGLDSTVLLHLLSQTSCLKGRVSAHYIDHDLQAASEGWGLHCMKVCHSLSIPFKSTKVKITSTKRKGLESVARDLRYQALIDSLNFQSDVLVTGHHQRDQAETVLLNLVRGSGVSGLSGMPSSKSLTNEKSSVLHVRPLLNIPYRYLITYAQHYKLTWIEDPSNFSTKYKRNVIRQEVLPVLKTHWPQVEKTVARTAQNMSEAQILLDRMAQLKITDMDGSGLYFDFNVLSSSDWLEQKNAVRYWFACKFNISLSTKHYEWIKGVVDVHAHSRQKAFSYKMSVGELRFYKSRLYYLVKPFQPFSFACIHQFNEEPMVMQFNNGCFEIKSGFLIENRADFQWCVDEKYKSGLRKVVVRSISQSDELNRKKLKAFFQKQLIPSWERLHWPVMEIDGVLVSVLGCCSCVKDAPVTKGAFFNIDFAGFDLNEIASVRS